MNNKKGSVTIFVMMFMVSLIMLFMVMIKAAEDAAVKGAFSSMGIMWCDSVLAEYDKNLEDRYDIFAFYGLTPEVNAKLRFYAGESVLNKRYITMSKAESSLSGFSLMDTENFKGQVIRASQYRIAGDIVGKAGEYEVHGEPQPKTEGGSALMQDLPSGGSEQSVTASGFRHAVESAGSIGGVIKSAGDLYLENRYIFSYFKDRSDAKDLGETYLNNEIEYIICGKKSDDAIENNMKLKLIAVRSIFNTIYAFEDPEINAETLAAAEIITPGAAPLTQKLLQTAWAACESVTDYNLLINGKKVPLYKDRGSWATSLESIIKGGIREIDEGKEPECKEEVPCIDPGNETGEDYHDYLNAMLFMIDENVKLLRMMDLMQINMRYCCYSDFRIREYNTGLEAHFEANGADVKIKRKYFGVD